MKKHSPLGTVQYVAYTRTSTVVLYSSFLCSRIIIAVPVLYPTSIVLSNKIKKLRHASSTVMYTVKYRIQYRQYSTVNDQAAIPSVSIKSVPYTNIVSVFF